MSSLFISGMNTLDFSNSDVSGELNDTYENINMNYITNLDISFEALKAKIYAYDDSRNKLINEVKINKTIQARNAESAQKPTYILFLSWIFIFFLFICVLFLHLFEIELDVPILVHVFVLISVLFVLYLFTKNLLHVMNKISL